ncbi:MAG: hypothetical protein ACYDAO_00730 [Thermoplasmataceae archaeon]
MNDSVDLRPLKLKALKLEDPIKSIILSQPDQVSREEYLSKAGDWLRLLEIREGIEK